MKNSAKRYSRVQTIVARNFRTALRSGGGYLKSYRLCPVRHSAGVVKTFRCVGKDNRSTAREAPLAPAQDFALTGERAAPTEFGVQAYRPSPAEDRAGLSKNQKA